MTDFTRRKLRINGVDTVVLEAGSGPPLVYLHGAGTVTGFDFAAPWSRKFRVVIPYHPGFGASAAVGQKINRPSPPTEYVVSPSGENPIAHGQLSCPSSATALPSARFHRCTRLFCAEENTNRPFGSNRHAISGLSYFQIAEICAAAGSGFGASAGVFAASLIRAIP